MKFLLILCLLTSPAFASKKKEKVNTDLKDVSKKVEKRKGYCSPLDKMMNKCKSMNKNDKEFVDKVKKDKDYCSPLQKATGGCKKKK